ncbi:uncharacterized protein PSFLO_04895 [Pseudozyma flocculosa]|uniref:Uncharacterized protein n=1 Tax=Pseudozyma flocculosa TaxID=84751 RepID=A0A5C3F4H5_9BASI|nr:uncharacterized protein PSFLO_04895 [Pseudozyma flocculosa]
MVTALTTKVGVIMQPPCCHKSCHNGLRSEISSTEAAQALAAHIGTHQSTNGQGYLSCSYLRDDDTRCPFVEPTKVVFCHAASDKQVADYLVHQQQEHGIIRASSTNIQWCEEHEVWLVGHAAIEAHFEAHLVKLLSESAKGQLSCP